MTELFNLNGAWTLYLAPNEQVRRQSFSATEEEDLKKTDFLKIPAEVPGNFELDLQRAGLLPDLYMGTNPLLAQKEENKHLWYVKRFSLSHLPEGDPFFRFEGIDTFAEIYLNGKQIFNRTPREAISNGFAFLTEERRATGIFGILDITENTTITALHKYRRWKLLLSDRKRRVDTDKMIRRLAVKTASRETQIRTLSGGNQQKVILSRWLLTSPQILLLDEPTRGIDVGAKYEIYVLLEELAAAGKSILMVSSELPELMGVCHRIYVMSGGEITGVVDAASTTQEQIMTLAAKNV